MLAIYEDPVLRSAIKHSLGKCVAIEDMYVQFAEQYKMEFCMYAEMNETYSHMEIESFKNDLNNGEFDHLIPKIQVLKSALEKTFHFHKAENKHYCKPVVGVW